MVLGRLGRTENSPSKSMCSILPLARHLRAGEAFRVSPPARTSLLKPAAGQQVQPPTIARAPTTASAASTQKSIASMHSPLSLAVGYNTIVTHGRRSCNNVVAILAKDKSTSLCSRCSTPVLWDADLFVFSNEI